MQLCIKTSYLKHKGTVLLETDRFILRQFKLSDVQDIFDNWSSDKDSAKYNAWNVHENEKVTKSYVKEWINYYKKINYYHWAIVDKNNDEVIGSISVSNIKSKKKYCEVGYTVAKKRWNQGIATEVLVYILEFLISDVGFETVHALHDIRNKASGRVMEKAGMLFIKNQLQIFLSSRNLIMNCSIYEYRRSDSLHSSQIDI